MRAHLAHVRRSADIALCLQGRGGGERVLQVFEEQLPQALNAQPFAQLLSVQSVKRIIQDSDGYQPFLVAPENGYRALIKEGVKLMEQPAAAAVDAVDMVLRDIGQKVRPLVTFCDLLACGAGNGIHVTPVMLHA
jgi:Dynamin central region